MNETKNKIVLIATIILLFTSAFVTEINTPVHAQLADEQPISGPLPAGVTADFTVYPKAYLSFRPTTVV